MLKENIARKPAYLRLPDVWNGDDIGYLSCQEFVEI